jgi:hypothetical protein
MQIRQAKWHHAFWRSFFGHDGQVTLAVPSNWSQPFFWTTADAKVCMDPWMGRGRVVPEGTGSGSSNNSFQYGVIQRMMSCERRTTAHQSRVFTRLGAIQLTGLTLGGDESPSGRSLPTI